MDVPRPPPRMVRLLELESAWTCSRSDGLEMRIPKVTLKSKIGHLEPELGNVEKLQDLADFHSARSELGGSVVNGQLFETALGLIFLGPTLDKGF